MSPFIGLSVTCMSYFAFTDYFNTCLFLLPPTVLEE